MKFLSRPRDEGDELELPAFDEREADMQVPTFDDNADFRSRWPWLLAGLAGGGIVATIVTILITLHTA